MAEFSSRWLDIAPDTPTQCTDKTDRSPFVSFVSGSPEHSEPNFEQYDLPALYARLRAIDDTPDFDTPAMRAERSRINQMIHQLTDATDGAT